MWNFLFGQEFQQGLRFPSTELNFSLLTIHRRMMCCDLFSNYKTKFKFLLWVWKNIREKSNQIGKYINLVLMVSRLKIMYAELGAGIKKRSRTMLLKITVTKTNLFPLKNLQAVWNFSFSRRLLLYITHGSKDVILQNRALRQYSVSTWLPWNAVQFQWKSIGRCLCAFAQQEFPASFHYSLKRFSP